MPKLIGSPTLVEAHGKKPKMIEEFVGLVNTGDSKVSIARMRSPGGWEEPGQRPEFHEFTLVLKGMLRVEHENGTLDVRAGQAVHTPPGEWIRYSTPLRKAPSTLPFACPRSRWPQSTVTEKRRARQEQLPPVV